MIHQEIKLSACFATFAVCGTSLSSNPNAWRFHLHERTRMYPKYLPVFAPLATAPPQTWVARRSRASTCLGHSALQNLLVRLASAKWSEVPRRKGERGRGLTHHDPPKSTTTACQKQKGSSGVLCTESALMHALKMAHSPPNYTTLVHVDGMARTNMTAAMTRHEKHYNYVCTCTDVCLGSAVLLYSRQYSHTQHCSI